MTDEERVDFLDQLDEDVDIVETGADDSIESSVDSDEADRLLGTEHSSSIRDEIDEDTRLTSNERAAARKSNSLTEADVGTEDGPAQIDPDDPIPVIEPHVHEVNAHLLFTSENYDAFGQDNVSDLNDREVIRRHDENALSPYWAVVSQWEENLQERYGTFEAAGHGWEFVPSGETDGAKYWNGKIATRGQSYDAFNEYQIGVRTTDELGARKVTLQLRPALPVATHYDTGDGLGNMPRDMPSGIRIQFGTSNVGPDQMLEVLRKLASHIDINPTTSAKSGSTAGREATVLDSTFA